MTINILDKERYVPNTFDNDKAENPIAFNIQPLRVVDQDEIEYMELTRVGEKDRFRIKTSWADVFRRGVESIENLSVNGKEVKTAEEYLAIRGSKKLTTIMTDVAVRIKGMSEEDEKN